MVRACLHEVERYRVLLRVEDTEFAKQLVYCILYCTVGNR